MDKCTMIEKLLQKYGKYGADVEEITYMVDAGFEYGLEPDYIMQNIEEQLSAEHKGE